MLGAGVVLRTPSGGRQPLVGMAEVMPGTDRYAAQVTVGREGHWQFQVEAWGDPIAHWRHDASIKVPRGLDVGLMMAEGAILFERAAKAIRPNRAATVRAAPAGQAVPAGSATPPVGSAAPVASAAPHTSSGSAVPAGSAAPSVGSAAPAGWAAPAGGPGGGGGRGRPAPRAARGARAGGAARPARPPLRALRAPPARLRDPAIPPWDRLAAADDEEILAILAAHPLRELLTR